MQKMFTQLKNYPRLWTIPILFIVVGVFGITLFIEKDALIAFEWQILWRYLPLIIILHFLALGAMFAAWHGMMVNFTENTDWRSNFQIYSLSTLARRIPLPIWYVGSRLYLYKQKQISPTKIAGATVLETILITFSGLICYLLLPESSTKTWLWFPILGVTMSVLFIGIIQPNLLIRLTNYVLSVLKKETLNMSFTRVELITWSTFYLCTWLLDGVGLYYTITTFTTTSPHLLQVIGISTLSALVSILSLFLPGGFGLKELTMSTLLSTFMPFSAGMVIAILYRFVNMIIEVAWMLLGDKIRRVSS